MKRFLSALIGVLISSMAFGDFPGSPISGGGGTSLTDNSVTSAYVADNSIKNVDVASDAGIVGSKMADNSVTNAKLVDATLDLAGTKVTGIVPQANGGTGSDNAAGARTSLGADNASNLSSGTIPAARIADNTLPVSVVIDNSAALIARFWTGAGDYLKRDGSSGTPAGAEAVTTLPWDNITSRPTINSVVVTGAVLDNASNYPTLNQNTSGTAAGLSGTPAISVSSLTRGTVSDTEFSYLDGVTSAIQTQLNARYKENDNVTFGTVTATEFVSSGADNTHKSNVTNTADPTTNLAIGDYQYNKTTKLWKFRNFDNSVWSEFFTSEGTNTGDFYTTGTLNGGQKTVAKTDNVTLSGSEVYGTWIEAGAGCDNVTLPAMSANMSVCVMATDNTQKRILPNGSDAIVYMDGTDFGNGHFALSVAAGATAPTGEFLCLKGSATANKWRVTGRGTTAWTDGGAP
jgi:hypothetical protein